MTDTTKDTGVHPVDEKLPTPRLVALGFQHVLVMYAGAIAVPLIVGRALKLSPEQVALLISADLFCCGIVTLIQSLGVTQWFGIRLPVMMGVTFAAVGPMVAMAESMPGLDGARTIFGAIIAAGVIGMVIAPLASRMLRFFPPVVTGTIIAIIGISLMRVGIGWAMGGPAFLAKIPDPAHLQAVANAKAAGTALPVGAAPMIPNPNYAALDNMAIALFVLACILLIAKYGRGFIANISVLLGIVIGGVVATLAGKMTFGKVASAHWFDLVLPFSFGMPIFDPVLIATMVLVMIVTFIESTGMFLALSDLTGRKLTSQSLAAGLRTDGLGTLIGGIFNTFPYTSFSQNVGLVGVTGVRSRFVCVAGGIILIVLGLIPKMAALVESLPQFVLGGAGLVMFGMVAATGVRILAGVDYKANKNNLYIVAVSISAGMIPLVAPAWTQHMPHGLHPLLESGILLTTISAVVLNLFFNGGGSAEAGEREARIAAMQAEGGH
ncbi:nucleobase:cation symporter-2 family protein [Leptothrix discophora]|uniref:Nucleobase:cation symporter-2 family protein n=1 Tax=Leptothrix discophora TaxID=89 RepID=A0ABT9G071_LEPDI|nr:nucleobase:cation symporter-2 family protein [Leptothrix discophora]MDP4299879.1 nucleobase:cation symporter-2 family protein [Leptothrix discophora]